ncbi:MAG: hypothetical protein ACLFT2_06145 [Candidatus Brocadiia bacterium]
MRRIVIAVSVMALSLLFATGCATVTGTASGVPMGAIDAPAETYRHNREAMDRLPILHGLNVVVMAPVGAVGGPVLGFGKGISLDVQMMLEQQQPAEVFGSYGANSVWRPWTVKWEIEE